MSHTDYNPRASRRFYFAGAGYEPETGIARLAYRFDDHPELIEEIHFPHAPWPPEASRQAAFEQALHLLHRVAGVSYYKAGAPAELVVENAALSGLGREFLNNLYIHGLAEFAHRNELDLSGRVMFTASEAVSGQSHELALPDRALVAMGGGKDSLVGLQLLRDAGLEVLPVCVGGSTLIEDTVRAAGLPLLRIGRNLAPGLSDLNRAGALNGHVPVTAIHSAILLCASILYGFRYIVFANERSADEATLVTTEGRMVNHQYSKSSAFESDFRRVIFEEVSPDIEYFSILRPWSELAVVKRFARLGAFHEIFSSCNRNFHQDGPRIENRWCLDCPKCRFAALSLGLFLAPGRVEEIMGGLMLDDPAQQNGFRELCQLGLDKPFECVGEAGECRAALQELARREAWSGCIVVGQLAPELEGRNVPALEDLYKPSNTHFIPHELQASLLEAWMNDETG